MSDVVAIVLMILLMIGVFILTLFITGWRMKRACEFILLDLEKQKAFDPNSAVALPYCHRSMFHIGLRDYRPKALNVLVQNGDIRTHEGGRYYLREGYKMTVTGGSAPS